VKNGSVAALIGVAALASAVGGATWERSKASRRDADADAARQSPRTEPPASRERAVGASAERLMHQAVVAKLDEMGKRLEALEAKRVPPERHADAETEREEPLSAKEVAARNAVLEQRVDATFAAERIETAWAGETEKRLSERLSSALGSDTTLVEPVRCRATICRVVASHTSESARDRFEELATRDRMGALVVPRNRPDAEAPGAVSGPPQSVVYYVREGSDGPDHALRLASQPPR
jgi:hypothetical protein